MFGDVPSGDYSADTAAVQAEVAEGHVWFQLRTALILDATGRLFRAGARRFVDFGCGNGLVMAALDQQGWETLGVDMYVESLRRAVTRTRGMLICSRIPNARLVEGSDVAGLFDVIEHVADDVALLEHVRGQLVPGGSVVVTVPALSALWSQFDVLLGHKRRYSRRGLVEVMERAGFVCEDARYCFGFAVPLVWLQRRVLERATRSRRAYYATPPRLLSALLRGLAGFERVLTRTGLRLPMGSSLIAVGRRP